MLRDWMSCILRSSLGASELAVASSRYLPNLVLRTALLCCECEESRSLAAVALHGLQCCLMGLAREG